MTKKLALIALSASVVTISGAMAYGDELNKHTLTQENNITITEALDEEKMVLVQENDDGTLAISTNGGETFEEFMPFEEEDLLYKVITKEDITKEIENAKASLDDKDFMSDWNKMGKTEEDMLTYISNLENQLIDIENGVVFTAVTSSTTFEGTYDIKTMTNDNIEISEQYSIAFEDENGNMDVIYGNSKEELYENIQLALENNEITQNEYDEIINSLN